MSLLAYGVIALGILGMLGGMAYNIRESGKTAVYLEWDKANAEARKREAAQGAAAATNLEVDREKRRVVYRTLTREVDKVVIEYRDRPCLDAGGLRLANGALSGTATPAAKPDPAVPSVDRAQ